MSTEKDDPGRPLLRVIAGGVPSVEEVAALVAAVALVATPPAEQQAQARSRWADRASALRRPLRPGPGAWRASVWR